MFVGLAVSPVAAQDPTSLNPIGGNVSSFGKAGAALQPSKKGLDKTAPVLLNADKIDYDNTNNRIGASGNVELYYNNYTLTADKLIYDRGANTLTAVGNVELKDPDGRLTRSERITLTEDFRDGFVGAVTLQTPDNTRIAAKFAVRRDANITEFRDAKYTPCVSAPGQAPLWCIAAAKIVHDQAAGTITYEDAEFDLLGTPILYAPYFQHPDPSVKRQTGFLLPEMSSSTNLGFALEIPYYVALAPNYDFTFHPLYSSKQGILWQGDWRHKVSFGDINGQYNIKLSALDQALNPIYNTTTGQKFDSWRGSLETKGKFSLSSWWGFGWDVTLESDDSFRRFYGLDSVLATDRVNNVFFTGQSDRNYFSAVGYYFGSLTLNGANNVNQANTVVHPAVDWNYLASEPVPIVGGEAGFDLSAFSFSRPKGTTDNQQTEINRAVVNGHWRRKLTDQIGITYTPFAEVRGDIYEYNNAVDAVTGATIVNETVSRGVASGGVLAAYPWVASSQGATHVVEPLAQIIGRTASVNQSRLPDEDAKSLVFDDTNLFEVDKFSGYDRIETGTRANVGLQYTFQAKSGGFGRVLVGQSYQVSGTNAFATPGTDAAGNALFTSNSGLQNTRSDYVLGLYAQPSKDLRGIGQVRVDQNTGAIRRADAFAQASYGPIWTSGQYSYTAADPLLISDSDKQEVLGWLGLRLTDKWSVAGSARVNLQSGSRVQDIMQLRYADDCFVLTTTYTETFVTDATRGITQDQSLMLRFELKSLGDFRYKTNALDTVFANNQPAFH